ncbi:hypothetical protein GPALN_005829 [Globodera pallida]|nr:hypothetical protein GPALN_005829 [Globodera pallida]
MMGLSTEIKFCLLSLLISTIIGQHRRHVAGGTCVDNCTTSTAGTPVPLAVVVGDLLAVNFTVCDRFGRELRRACKMRLQFWLEARKAEREGRLLPATELPPPSPGLGMPTFRKPTPAEKAAQPPPSVVSERYACFNTSCLRAYMHGSDSPRSGPCSYGRRSRRASSDGSSKTILAKCERMEYRMLSDNQRARFTDSIMWSNLFMGTSDNDDGQIANGFLANWITASGHKIQRYLGKMMPSNLLTENQVIATITYREMQGIFAFAEGTSTSNCTQPIPDDEQILEMNHNNVHAWIGGEMAQLVTSTQDPIFFLHHCFVDYVWEQWRIMWQTREEREAQFPSDAQVVACSGSTYCRLNATMLPFQDPIVLNSAGLSNDYTDNLYTYAPRPTCKLAGECGSA